MPDTAKVQLTAVYQRYYDDLRSTAPELLDDGYSNPYYSSIPDGWFESTTRIMIVGEEGFGTWGCGKGDEHPIPANDFETIQNLNYNYLRKQLLQDDGKLNNSAFWKRFRKISPYGVCSWTNIDKIHRLANKNCALSQTERKKLHSINTRVLFEEINILNPTHIIFFGWYGVSLRHELPDVYSLLYPNGSSDNSLWDQNVVPIQNDGRIFIFAYHPNWGYRNKGYEDKVLKTIQDHI